jgi:hypothetical protein
MCWKGNSPYPGERLAHSPYDGEPTRWIEADWIDQYTGNLYRITTESYHGARETARVKTYGEILREYEFHPEAKCADAAGNTCERQTVGLLQQRHVHIEGIRYIGKESNTSKTWRRGLFTLREASTPNIAILKGMYGQPRLCQR